jgi:hypothetical protein
MSLKSFLLTLFALFTLLHLTMCLPTGPPSNIPSTLSLAWKEERQMGQGYVLQCTVGRSASECQEQFDTYCDTNGLIRNGATIAQANGECSMCSSPGLFLKPVSSSFSISFLTILYVISHA